MGGDGILGVGDIERIKEATSGKRRWLKRRERWLVVLGVVLHAVYMLSIFDIYFKTPIVHGMEPVTPRFEAPAKRLVLMVGTVSGASSIRCLDQANFTMLLAFDMKWVRLVLYCWLFIPL